jgi:hypothetical protein
VAAPPLGKHTQTPLLRSTKTSDLILYSIPSTAQSDKSNGRELHASWYLLSATFFQAQLLILLLGNHFDDTASTVETSSVYDLKARRHDDDEDTVDDTLSLASVPVGRSAVGDRNYGEEDGLGPVDGDDEAELPAHACA